MKFVKEPAEKTTAITDLILALVAVGGILLLHWNTANSGELWKIYIWSMTIGLIGLAAALGAVAHGLVITQVAHDRIWRMLNLCLALAVSLFVAGVVYDLWGLAACLKSLPMLVLAGFGFFAATLLYPGIFFVFILYEGLALIFALGVYTYLTVSGDRTGSGLIAAGILLSIVAAAIQAKKSISFTLIWHFDHNGIYHLVQMPGIILLAMGLRRSLI